MTKLNFNQPIQDEKGEVIKSENFNIPNLISTLKVSNTNDLVKMEDVLKAIQSTIDSKVFTIGDLLCFLIKKSKVEKETSLTLFKILNKLGKVSEDLVELESSEIVALQNLLKKDELIEQISIIEYGALADFLNTK